MNREIINTTAAPSPIGPYNQAIKAGNLLFVSGQIAIDPSSGNLITDSIAAETQQVMKNITAILKEAGAGFNNIVKTTIFLSDMSLFAEVNEIYGGYFTAEHGESQPVFPARETVAVKGLPKNVNVEISVIAAL
ncbi:MAG: RidA family protein [Ferruginibacter sp.]